MEEQKDNILLELIEIDRIDCITFPEINLVKADFLTVKNTFIIFLVSKMCFNSIWLNTLVLLSMIGVMLVLHLQLRLAMNLI